MPTTQILFGSYAHRFPDALKNGIKIKKDIFGIGYSGFRIEHFNEPAEAMKLRREIWAAAIEKRIHKIEEGGYKDGQISHATIYGQTALMQAKDGAYPAPVAFAGPLYATTNPVSPKFFLDTDWSHFEATREEAYINELEKAGVQPPLFVGMHIESQKVGWVKRPDGSPCRPGETHPPSTSMRYSDPRLVAEQFLFTSERLGKLGCEDFDQALKKCEIILGSMETFTPMAGRAPRHPYLVDYRFIFE